MQWSKLTIRIVISVVCALVFIFLCFAVAGAISRLLPNTFMTRQNDLGWVTLPPLVFIPVLGPMMLFVWLGLDLHGDFSVAAFLYRITVFFGVPILFYSAINYWLLGRLKWFRQKIDQGPLPEPPSPPEF
jgi:hypothetical protein